MQSGCVVRAGRHRQSSDRIDLFPGLISDADSTQPLYRIRQCVVQRHRLPFGAAATASLARVNTAKKASPCVSTSRPSCAANAWRISRRCVSSNPAQATSPNAWLNFVEPSTSENKNVTVPWGSVRMRRILPATSRRQAISDPPWICMHNTTRQSPESPAIQSPGTPGAHKRLHRHTQSAAFAPRRWRISAICRSPRASRRRRCCLT